MAEYRPNEYELEFILDWLRPVDPSKCDCYPHDAEEQSYGNRTVKKSFVRVAFLLNLHQSFQFLQHLYYDVNNKR